MLLGSFAKLWNIAVFSVGAGWLVLVSIVWNSGQLATVTDSQVFFFVLMAGFLLIYSGGFLINARHRNKKTQVS